MDIYKDRYTGVLKLKHRSSKMKDWIIVIVNLAVYGIRLGYVLYIYLYSILFNRWKGTVPMILRSRLILKVSSIFKTPWHNFTS